MPTLILALNYWIHLVATVLWLGGLAVLSLIVWPGLLRQSAEGLPSQTMDAIEGRFWPIANVSLAALIITGTLQMSDDPHYNGFLKVNSPWAVGLLAKHVVIGGIIAASIALQWSVRPAIERAALLARRGDAEARAEEAALRRRSRWLTWLSLGLGGLVLMLTAYITAL